MTTTLRLLSSRALLTALVLTTAILPESASAADWVDTEGNTFIGEPAGLLGPLALFKTGRARGRRLPLANLRPEDALRYDQGLRVLPARAEAWADGKSMISRELVGHLQRVRDGKLVDDELRDQPEPELLLVLFAESGMETRELLNAADGPYRRLKEKFGHNFEVLFIGVRHSLGDHVSLATGQKMPWLVMNRARQTRLDELAVLAPEPAPGYALISRHGVPITSMSGIVSSDIDQIFAQIEGLLVAMVPNNPRTWMERVAYHGHVRRAEFAQGEAPPLLVGPPLLDAVLAQIGVTAFELVAEVDATGKATQVDVQPGPGLPEKYVKAVARSFATVPFVPAVRNGEFVAGTLRYTYRAP